MDGTNATRSQSRNHTFPSTYPAGCAGIQPAAAYRANAFDFRRMETAKKGENAPDTKRIKETLEKFSLENMRYVGILKSGQKVSGFIEAEGYVYTVGVGNYLGQNYGRIESITDDSIILNELIEDSTGNWVSRKAELLLNSSDKNTEQAAAPAAEQN